MKDPPGVCPSKGNQGTTRGKEKILLTSVGLDSTTSGLDLPLLCRLSYEVGQRESGTSSDSLSDLVAQSILALVCYVSVAFIWKIAKKNENINFRLRSLARAS